MEYIIGAIGIVVLLGVLMIPAYLLNGFVLMKLWQWFLVPLGLPVIGLAHCIGIAIIINFLTMHYQKSPKESDDGGWNAFAHLYLNPLFVLFIGWIVTWFI